MLLCRKQCLRENQRKTLWLSFVNPRKERSSRSQMFFKIGVLYTSSDEFKFLGKKNMLIWLKNVNYVKKLPINNGESFLESNFDLNQICKILLTRNFIFFLTFKEMLWWHIKCQKVKVWRRLSRVITKTLLAQTISDKIFWTK